MAAFREGSNTLFFIPQEEHVSTLISGKAQPLSTLKGVADRAAITKVSLSFTHLALGYGSLSCSRRCQSLLKLTNKKCICRHTRSQPRSWR